MPMPPPNPNPRRKRRKLLVLAAVFGGLAAVFFGLVAQWVDRYHNPVTPRGLLAISDRARALHRDLTIVDLHADSLIWDRDLSEHHDYGHVDLPRLRAGRVALQVFSAVSQDPASKPGTAQSFDQITPLVIASRWPLRTWTSRTERALQIAARLERARQEANGALSSVLTAKDLTAITPDQPRALLALEGAQPIEGKLDNYERLFRAGVRMIGLTHFFDNELAGSAHGVAQGGLTTFGETLIERMQRDGVVIDLAHASARTIDDVVQRATRPVVVSHTGVKGTCDNERNLSDDQLRAIAATGGVIGIAYFEWTLCGIEPSRIGQAARHAARIVGAQHLALGSDFDGAVEVAFDTSQLVQVTQSLLDAGFSDDEIRGIMGRNAVRTLNQAMN
jgi:microsomal dipeptidase-like Zn-dependent dipeptidase